MANSGEPDLVRCCGCGGLFANVEGATHRYMKCSPGCWAAYGEVLARQYQDPSYAAAGQMTVDAYAIQHPGQPSRQSIQSVARHLMSLCLVLEQGLPPTGATQMLARLAKHPSSFVWLTPPSSVGDMTVQDVLAAPTAADHRERVLEWGATAWRAWSLHHQTIRKWLP